MPDAFDPQSWLQLGIAGGALLVLLITVWLNYRAHWSWQATVDKIAERQDDTQKETNTVLRDLSSLMNRMDVKIDGKGRAA